MAWPPPPSRLPRKDPDELERGVEGDGGSGPGATATSRRSWRAGEESVKQSKRPLSTAKRIPPVSQSGTPRRARQAHSGSKSIARARDQPRARGPGPVAPRGCRQDAGPRREQAKTLLDSIDASTAVGARDRLILAMILFSFARVGAVVRMRVCDYRGGGTKAATFVFHEKGGKFCRVAAHHTVGA